MGLFLDWQFKFVGVIFRNSFCPLSRVYGFLSFTFGLLDAERRNNDLSHMPLLESRARPNSITFYLSHQFLSLAWLHINVLAVDRESNLHNKPYKTCMPAGLFTTKV